jgi:hypothetical protein
MQKKSALSKAASLIGRAGGKRCLETMTPEQRRERARKAGKASGRVRAKKARAARAAAKRKKG